MNGFDLLIRAMPKVLRRVPGATLLVAGHDPWGYEKTLKSLVRQLGLDGLVQLVGLEDNVSSSMR